MTCTRTARAYGQLIHRQKHHFKNDESWTLKPTENSHDNNKSKIRFWQWCRRGGGVNNALFSCYILHGLLHALIVVEFALFTYSTRWPAIAGKCWLLDFWVIRPSLSRAVTTGPSKSGIYDREPVSTNYSSISHNQSHPS